MTRIWVICWSAFVLGGVGLYAASRELGYALRRARLTKFVTYFCIVNGMLVAAAMGRMGFSVILLAIVTLGAQELIALLPIASAGQRSVEYAMGVTYLVIVGGAVAFAWQARPALATTVYLVICTFDGFSQVTGQLIGRRKLAPRLSPGKTIEGTLGGLIAALAMMLLLRSVVGWPPARSLAAGGFLAVAALTGDLLASAVKRRSGVKDFGTRLPGHGGILDRFDSFLFASAAWSAIASVAGIWGNWSAW